MGKGLPRSVAFLITLVAVIPACSSGHRYMAVNEATGLPVAGAPLIASTAICVPHFEGTVEVVVGTSGEDGTATVAQHGNRAACEAEPREVSLHSTEGILVLAERRLPHCGSGYGYCLESHGALLRRDRCVCDRSEVARLVVSMPPRP